MKEKLEAPYFALASIFLMRHRVTKPFIPGMIHKWNIITLLLKNLFFFNIRLFHSDQDNISFPFQDRTRQRNVTQL